MIDGARPIARVTIERRGGFAGLHAQATLDAAALDAAERRALDALVAGAASGPRAASPGADRFSYRVRVEFDDGGDTAFDLPEDAMPAALAARVRPVLP